MPGSTIDKQSLEPMTLGGEHESSVCDPVEETANGTVNDTVTNTLETSIDIHEARTSEEMGLVKQCFIAYFQWLNEDISFQDYLGELEGLPGKYGAPTGALLIARDKYTGETLGCVALRRLELEPEYQRKELQDLPEYCEIKRLFIYPKARGRGVAKRLLREIEARARKMGYDEILLDTLARMTAARRLYSLMGFVETDAYYYNPLKDPVYYRKVLA